MKNLNIKKNKNFFYYNLIISFLIIVFFIGILFVILKFLLPSAEKMFKVPHSSVIEDINNELLYATVADDFQWRFPVIDTVPYKFATCIVQFEDARFYWHNGFDVFSLFRALYNNIKAKKIVNGGSTISMQVIRLSRKNKKRTIGEKIIEIIKAIFLEIKCNKKQILALYSSYAPFGRNIVGLQAASWLYYNISPKDLSWGQAATLAVLPNAPSLVYPGKNDALLIDKRNSLLLKLYNKKIISLQTYQNAINEPLPGFSQKNPNSGIHLLNKAIKDGLKGNRIKTTIEKNFQELLQIKVNKHAKYLEQIKVYNVAAIVVDIETNNVIAYVGNRTDTKEYQSEVDILNSPRSPGSVLKPLLYCAVLNEGLILPYSLVPDIPTFLDGFHPENFTRTYEGAVSASFVLSRSLNVPAVQLLKKYSVEKFHLLLNSFGLSTIKKPSSHYGLTLILGGVEVKLFEIVGVYASMARVLNNHLPNVNNKEFTYFPFYQINENFKNTKKFEMPFSAGEIWYTFKAMTEVARSEDEQMWQFFSSKQTIAWKTGTSYGERDAWAVGITPKYVVGVWVGNATGEGRPGLTGFETAAPLMFDIFNLLPKAKWFNMPIDDMIELSVCSKSGFRFSQNCESSYIMYVPKNCINASLCPYHKLIHLDKSKKWRVNANCEDFSDFVEQKWFVLPPIMEFFFKKNKISYKQMPPLRDDCKELQNESNFEIIYPSKDSKIYLIDEQSQTGKIIMSAAHKKRDAILFWHIDNNFIGTTQKNHSIETRPSAGKHTLVVFDNFGERKVVVFEVFSK